MENAIAYPVRLLNAIGIREAKMAECGGMECRRLAKQDTVSIQEFEKCILPQPTHALCKTKCLICQVCGSTPRSPIREEGNVSL
jgi:hypothetical protein